MKPEDYRDALALIAEADQRSTATLIEHIVAAVLLKTKPPQGKEVSAVTFTPADIDDLFTTHHFEAEYDGEGGMTLFLTRLA